MFSEVLFEMSWSMWCACRLVAIPQASHFVLMCFLALTWYPDGVNSTLEFAQESEQNLRRRNTEASSSLPEGFRVRLNFVPHHSQVFSGICFARIGISQV